MGTAGRRAAPLVAAALLLTLGLMTAPVTAMPSWYSCSGGGCAGVSPPSGLAPHETPQFILLTHDDAVNPTR